MTSPPLSARREVRPDVVLAIAALGVFMEFVDSTIVNIAFPAIHRSFRTTTIATLSWILNGYSIVFAAFLVVSGRLADLLGRRRMFRAGVALFTLASALCGLAPNPSFLIGMRALQALGGAMVVPSSMALVIQAFPVDRRARATTIYGATAALAAALGPPIGGALIKLDSWRLCFYINVPVGIVVLLLSTRMLVESRSPGRRLVPDITGALLLAVALGSLTLGIVRGADWGWSSLRIVGAFVLAAAASSVFAWRTSWHRAPIVDPSLVRLRHFQVVNGAMLLAGAGFYGYLLCHALYLMLVWGYSAFEAGLTFVPGALIAAVTAGASRRLEARGFVALVVPGAVLWVGGMVWYWQVIGLRPAFVSEWLPGSVITGIGAGLVLPALGAAAIVATPGTGYAMAGALNTTARQIGGALGIAIVVVLIGPTPSPTSLRHGWLFAGCLFLALVVIGALLAGLRPAEAGAAAEDAWGGPVGFGDNVQGRLPARTPAPEATTLEAGGLAGFLRTVPMFETLTRDQLDDIAGIATTVRVGAGSYLFRRGDPADGLYILRAGRVEVLLRTADGVRRGEIGRGDVIGELALLAEPRRAATVQAKRDSELIFVSRTDFELMLLAVPELSVALAARLARLIQQGLPVEREPHRALPVTIAVMGAGGDAATLGRRIAESLPGAVAMVDEAALATGDRIALLDTAERTHDRVLLLAGDAPDNEWSRFCLSQADAVVLAAGGGPPPALPVRTPCIVVVPGPEHVRPWVRMHADDVRRVVADVPALARQLSGRATGLVLSGGGARALAHVGVIDGLAALGITVDRVAGAGTGALVGAMLAAGWTPDEIDAACYEELVRRRPFSGYRLSRTALLRPERVVAMLARLFGDVLIEELPREFVCVSADLVRGERVEHRSGPVAAAVLAAITTVGLLPPVAAGDRLLIDAGVLDNLPVDLLDPVGGPVIAVDVAPRGGVPDAVVPNVAEALARAMVLGSFRAAEAARRRADISIVPDTQGVGTFEFHQVDVLRAAGRDAVRAAFAR